VLEPDIYIDSDKLVLTMFVAPRPGFQTGSSNPETPVRIALPEPIGTRTLIDGALAPASLDAPSLQARRARRQRGRAVTAVNPTRTPRRHRHRRAYATANAFARDLKGSTHHPGCLKVLRSRGEVR